MLSFNWSLICLEMVTQYGDVQESGILGIISMFLE